MAMVQSRHQVILKSGIGWEVMLDMDDHTFASHFRIRRPRFDRLLQVLQEGGLQSQHSHGIPPLPVSQKALMFLWYMANQNSFREMSDKFNVSPSSAHTAILQVLTVMSGIGHQFVSWPRGCEKRLSSAVFQRSSGLDRIIGAIDGCHIRVQRPTIRGGDYMNRKGYYSVLLQGIVNDEGRFIDIFAGPPGRVHDARVLRGSTFFEDWQDKMGDYRLLGDSAYIGQAFPFILTPKRDNGALTNADRQQNYNLSRGRVIVEQAFGRMKCKWRRIRDLQNTRMDVVVMIIMAACFLHNFALGVVDGCDEHPEGCPREEDDNE